MSKADIASIFYGLKVLKHLYNLIKMLGNICSSGSDQNVFDDIIAEKKILIV